MSKIQYPASSPYFDTGQTSWYMSPIKLRDIPPDSTDVLYVVDKKYEFKPTLMSDDAYGTPSYWWVFMVRNMDAIRDPIWDLKAGLALMIPTKKRITELLG